ncbi:3'-5' exonuclease [uncultured Croceitalea sp.]|uniref:3'-5' exonuclease n=1 Tax=uncultured Croceitalea sp. TaxID=1798908 RepID=UPI003305C6BA
MISRRKKEYPDYWNEYEASFYNGLSKNVGNVNFVVLDTETTGFDVKRDRILSIGALRIKNGTINVRESFEVFIEQKHFDEKTVAIHGILKKGKVKQVSELEGLKRLLCLLKNAVLIAHHVGFDVGMLNQALKRNGLPKLKNRTLDTAVLYNRSLPQREQKINGHFTLDELAAKFDISTTDRHTALGDAYITGIAFLHILSKLKPASTQNLLKRDRFSGFWRPF